MPNLLPQRLRTASSAMESATSAASVLGVKEYNLAQKQHDQFQMIKRLAKAKDRTEDEMEMCEHLLRTSSDFLSLVFKQQRAYISDSEKSKDSKTKAKAEEKSPEIEGSDQARRQRGRSSSPSRSLADPW
jgi:hypothetical protein